MDSDQKRKSPADTTNIDEAQGSDLQGDDNTTSLALSFSTGGYSNTTLTHWQGSFDDFILRLQEPAIGPKDGSYFVRGPCPSGKRSDDNITRASVVIIDGDKQIDPETGKALVIGKTNDPKPKPIYAGSIAPELAHEALRDLGIPHCLYTSHSHDPDKQMFRWRAVIPADIPDQGTLIAVVNWVLSQLREQGLGVYNSTENYGWQQPWYFPRVRDEAARAHFRFFDGSDADPLPMADILAWYQEQLAKRGEQAPKLPAGERKLKPKGDTPIGRFNATYGNLQDLAELLETYGYEFITCDRMETIDADGVISEKKAYRFLYPLSQSHRPGVHVYQGDYDGEWLLYSHHSDDPLRGKGEKPRTLDAFGVWQCLEHGDDGQRALSEWKRIECEQTALHYAEMVDASAMLAGASGEGDPEPAPPPIAYPDPFPGFMADVCRNVLDTAMAPQPHLTTLAVLIGMAGSIGGRYHLPSGGRLNLYGIGIADSGTGKDHPQGVARQIAGEAEAKILGKPASGQALEDELDDYAAIFLGIDEVAHLFESINGKNKAPHLIELASMLLRLFSDSKRTYYSRSRAKAKGVTPGRPIPHPCLSVLGFATPQKLGESVTIGNVEDGLLGRMLFAPGLKDPDTRRIFTPFDLGDRAKECKALWNRPPPHLEETPGNIPRLDEAIHRVRYAPEADAALDQFMTEINAAKKATEEAFDRALMARTFEKAERVAGVLAVWDKPKHPIMTAEHVAWAASLVRASNATARGFVRDHVHEGDVLKYAERVKETMLKIMDGKIKPMRPSWARLKSDHNVAAKSWVLKASKLGKPEFDKGVDHLIDEEILKKGGGREQAGCGKEPEWLRLVNPS